MCFLKDIGEKAKSSWMGFFKCRPQETKCHVESGLGSEHFIYGWLEPRTPSRTRYKSLRWRLLRMVVPSVSLDYPVTRFFGIHSRGICWPLSTAGCSMLLKLFIGTAGHTPRSMLWGNSLDCWSLPSCHIRCRKSKPFLSQCDLTIFYCDSFPLY